METISCNNSKPKDSSSEKNRQFLIDARWVRKAKNWDVSTGPLTCPFALSLAPLTRLLAPHCLLCSRAPLRSLVRSLAHSQARFWGPTIRLFSPTVRWSIGGRKKLVRHISLFHKCTVPLETLQHCSIRYIQKQISTFNHVSSGQKP